MVRTLQQRFQISTSSTQVVTVDFGDRLKDGELIASATVEVQDEISSGTPTVTNVKVSTAEVTDQNGDTIAIGTAVQCVVTSDEDGTAKLRVTATTDSTPAQVLPYDFLITFE